MKQILIVEDDSFLNKMLDYNPVSYTHQMCIRDRSRILPASGILASSSARKKPTQSVL